MVSDVTRPVNVLLMLSTEERPDPQREIAWHIRNPFQGRISFVATTKELSHLEKGKSIVAFYGNRKIRNEYLGQGIFRGVIYNNSLNLSGAVTDLVNQILHEGTTSNRVRRLCECLEIYRGNNIPSNIKGFVVVENLQAAAPGQTIEDLNGIIWSPSGAADDGKPLTLLNLPGRSADRVYFKSGLS
jgi:hypothetical protein